MFPELQFTELLRFVPGMFWEHVELKKQGLKSWHIYIEYVVRCI